MAELRATKSGLAAEAKAKMDAKYDPLLAGELMAWLQDITKNENVTVDGDLSSVYQSLKDGIALCQLVNAFQEGLVKKINQSTMAFKCMENINNFLLAAAKLGVPNHELFQTVDLWERQNMASVLICIQSLARKAGKYGQPSLGPREAEVNLRNFSEEQLKGGEGVIGYQSGYNPKGANQSGINFGNTRHM